MPDYTVMSLDELEAHAYSMPHTDICDFAAVRWELVKRRIVRDVFLDLAEQLDAEGWVVVPRQPTPRMLHAADGYTDLIQPFVVIEVPGENRAKEAKEWRHEEFKCAWWAMINNAPLPASPSSVEG